MIQFFFWLLMGFGSLTRDSHVSDRQDRKNERLDGTDEQPEGQDKWVDQDIRHDGELQWKQRPGNDKQNLACQDVAKETKREV